MGNPHEDVNRMTKVIRLADAFTAHAIDAMKPADKRLLKKKKVTVRQCVSMMAREAEDDLWIDLAEAYGINKPSPRTIKATKLYLERRAEFQCPTNPLEGLPR